ncbi:hypothetical protein [Streptomyces sp. NPDC046805]
MSDAKTSQPRADLKEVGGHGRHRGPVSGQEKETAPRGRHRKAEPSESAA